MPAMWTGSTKKNVVRRFGKAPGRCGWSSPAARPTSAETGLDPANHRAEGGAVPFGGTRPWPRGCLIVSRPRRLGGPCAGGGGDAAVAQGRSAAAGWKPTNRTITAISPMIIRLQPAAQLRLELRQRQRRGGSDHIAHAGRARRGWPPACAPRPGASSSARAGQPQAPETAATTWPVSVRTHGTARQHRAAALNGPGSRRHSPGSRRSFVRHVEEGDGDRGQGQRRHLAGQARADRLEVITAPGTQVACTAW